MKSIKDLFSFKNVLVVLVLIGLTVAAITLPHSHAGATIDPIEGEELCKATFSTNGGTSVTNKDYVCGVAFSLPTTTKTGYTFNGWSTSSSCSSPITGETTINSATHFYACWTAIYRTISYDANGGTGAPASSQFVYGSSVTVSTTVPTRSGYTFVEWNTDSSGRGNPAQPGDNLGTQTSNITLYAIWNGSYVISFIGYDGSQCNYASVTQGQSYTINVANPTATGNTFKGWTTTKGSSTVVYVKGNSFIPTGNTTLYSVWEKNVYSVTYNSNGGSNVSSGSVSHGSTYTISSTVPTKSGYTFKGWDIGSDGTADYQAGGKISNVTGNVTLTAVWGTSGSENNGLINTTNFTALDLKTVNSTNYANSKYISGGFTVKSAVSKYCVNTSSSSSNCTWKDYPTTSCDQSSSCQIAGTCQNLIDDCVKNDGGISVYRSISTIASGSNDIYLHVKNSSGTIDSKKVLTYTYDNDAPVCTWASKWSPEKLSNTSSIELNCSDVSGVNYETFDINYSASLKGEYVVNESYYDNSKVNVTFTRNNNKITVTATCVDCGKLYSVLVNYKHKTLPALKSICDNAGNCAETGSGFAPLLLVGSDSNPPTDDPGDTPSTQTDTTAPTCSVTNLGTTWTNYNRSIELGCTDSGSGCETSNTTKLFSDSTKTYNYNYTIKDKAGNTRTCTGTTNIYVDKTTPTFEVTVDNGATASKTHTATFKVSDTYSGFASGSVKVKYDWSTTEITSCSALTKEATINISSSGTGSASVSEVITGNGNGKIYACLASNISDRAGNSLTGNTLKSATLNLDSAVQSNDNSIKKIKVNNKDAKLSSGKYAGRIADDATSTNIVVELNDNKATAIINNQNTTTCESGICNLNIESTDDKTYKVVVKAENNEQKEYNIIVSKGDIVYIPVQFKTKLSDYKTEFNLARNFKRRDKQTAAEDNDFIKTGYKYIDTYQEEEDVTLVAFVPGDVNGDGEINIADLTKAYKYTKNNELSSMLMEDRYAASVANHTNEVSVNDITKLFKYVKGHDINLGE